MAPSFQVPQIREGNRPKPLSDNRLPDNRLSVLWLG